AGERIGVIALGSGGTAYAEILLADYGLGVEDVEFLPLGVGGPAFETLKNGDVAAFVSFDGDLATGVAAGYDIKLLNDPDWQTEIYGFNMYAMDSYIEENPTVIEAVGRSIARATSLVASDPEEAIKYFW